MERKVVSIVFADITASTELAERLDAERVSEILRRFFLAMSEILERWGGRVEKYIGDAVMAVFGLPTVHEDDAERAVRAAVEMQARLAQLNGQLERLHGVRLAVRVGVNTGEVVVPDSGPGPMVAGDAVNVAARLQQAAAPGEVLAGEATMKAVRGPLAFDAPRTLRVKGKAQPLVGFPVIGADTGVAASARKERAAFVGRRGELQALREALREAIEERRPRMLIVEGDAGVGKSRLLRELEASLLRTPAIRILHGRCLVAGQRLTFGALGEILRGALGIGEDESAETTGLRASVAALLEPLGHRPAEIDRIADTLALSAGIEMPDNPLSGAAPAEVARELQGAWPRFLSGIAARAPHVVVLEDLHWASSALLDLVPLLLDAEGPILLVGTSRPGDRTWARTLEERPDVVRLDLGPLDAGKSQELFDALVAADAIPTGLRRAAIERADGNPFFLEELARHLLEGGAAAATELPHSIHALLAARIDRLPSPEKRALREAAVMGRFFDRDALARAIGGPVERALEALERHGLVLTATDPRTSEPTRFAFRHALIREVAYAGISKRRRAIAHADFAAWLEATTDAPSERLERIAEHYQAALAGVGADLAWAEDPVAGEAVRQRGFAAQLVAGDHLRGRSAVARALELHEAGLGLALGDAERARAIEAIGDDHDALYHGDEAWQAYREALAIRRADGEPAWVARLASKLAAMAAGRWGTFRNRPDPVDIEAVVDEGLSATPGTGPERAALLSYKGATGLRWLAEGRDDPIGIQVRIASAEEALDIASRLDLTNHASNACMTLTQLYSLVGDFPRALEVAERALPLDERIVATRASSTGFESANVVAEVGGRFADALPRARRSLERGRQMSAHHLMHGSYTTMNVLFHLGRWDEIPALLEEHLDALASERGRGCPYVRAGPVLGALVLAQRGEGARAHDLLDDHARHAGTGLGGAPDAIAARAYVALGEASIGRSLAERVLESGRHITTEENAYEYVAWLEALTELGDLDGLARALERVRSMSGALAVLPPAIDRADGIVLAADGQIDAARERLQSALSAYDRMGVLFESARTREHLAEIVEPVAATALRIDAARTYGRLGARPHLARVTAVHQT